MTFANALADVEPEDNLSGDKCVQPGLLDRQVLVGTSLGTLDQVTKTLTDGWNIGWCWGSQLHFGVFQEHIQLWSCLHKKPCQS